MDLSSLRYAEGSKDRRKRLGRGNASGHGGSSGRGTKGALSRSGTKRKVWLEGGQMPIHRRLPKRGFRNIFKKEFQIININDLNKLDVPEVTIELLHKKRLIKSLKKPVKILGRGEIESPIKVFANLFSKSAKDKIEAAGGKAEVV